MGCRYDGVDSAHDKDYSHRRRSILTASYSATIYTLSKHRRKTCGHYKRHFMTLLSDVKENSSDSFCLKQYQGE